MLPRMQYRCHQALSVREGTRQTTVAPCWEDFPRFFDPAADLSSVGWVQKYAAGPLLSECILLGGEEAAAFGVVRGGTGIEVEVVDVVEGLKDSGGCRPFRREAREEALVEALAAEAVVDADRSRGAENLRINGERGLIDLFFALWAIAFSQMV